MSDQNIPLTGEELLKILGDIQKADIADFIEEGEDSIFRLNIQNATEKGATKAVRKFSVKDGKICKITLRNGQSLRVNADGVIIALKS